MTITTTLTSAPDLPDRTEQDQTTFDTRMATYWAYLKNDFEPELNDITDEINSTASTIISYVSAASTSAINAATAATNAANSETAAVAAANFKGNWADLTGALAIPASVYHSDNVWLLIEDLADVTAEVPGVSTKWRSLSQLIAGVNLIASGTVDNGAVVILNSDGTVSMIVGNATFGGTPAVFESAISYYISATFDSSSNKIVIAYRDDGNSSYGTAVVGTVSGTSITFGTPAVFESASSSYISATFDSSSNKIVIAYRDDGNSSYGTAVVITPESTNANDWIGISSDAYTDGQTAQILMFGDVSDNQSGLTINEVYYVDVDGSLTTSETIYGSTPIGKAISATQLLITGANV